MRSSRCYEVFTKAVLNFPQTQRFCLNVVCFFFHFEFHKNPTCKNHILIKKKKKAQLSELKVTAKHRNHLIQTIPKLYMSIHTIWPKVPVRDTRTWVNLTSLEAPNRLTFSTSHFLSMYPLRSELHPYKKFFKHYHIHHPSLSHWFQHQFRVIG